MDYFRKLGNLLRTIDPAVVGEMAKEVGMARCVFVIGNGGSMASAVHFAGDLSKNARKKAMALDNITAVTAHANDDGYKHVFDEQLKRWAIAGDVLVAVSTSGTSANVVQAAKVAKEKGMFVIGLTANGGGALAPLCDISITLPDAPIEMHEDAHMAILHAIVWGLK